MGAIAGPAAGDGREMCLLLEALSLLLLLALVSAWDVYGAGLMSWLEPTHL